MDNISRSSRRRIMRAITGDNLGPERRFAAALRRAGAPRFRRNVDALPGSPDVVFPEHRVAIQVLGDFWHCCPFHYRPPHCRNWRFWRNKILENCERDYRKADELRALGWHVLGVWECRVHNDAMAQEVAEFVVPLLKDIQAYSPPAGPIVYVPFGARPGVTRKEAKEWKLDRRLRKLTLRYSARAATASS